MRAGDNSAPDCGAPPSYCTLAQSWGYSEQAGPRNDLSEILGMWTKDPGARYLICKGRYWTGLQRSVLAKVAADAWLGPFLWMNKGVHSMESARQIILR